MPYPEQCFNPVVPPIADRFSEKFCYVRLAEPGDGEAMAACLYEGAEDTYPHPYGKFGATQEAVRNYLDTGPEALRVRKDKFYWERRIIEGGRDGSLRVVEERDGGVIAFSQLTFDEERGLCELDAIYTRRAARRAAIRAKAMPAGSLLMHAALQEGQDRELTLHFATTAWNGDVLYRFYGDHCGAVIVQPDAVLPKVAPLEAAGIDLRQTGAVVFNNKEICRWPSSRRLRVAYFLRNEVYLARTDIVNPGELRGKPRRSFQ